MMIDFVYFFIFNYRTKSCRSSVLTGNGSNISLLSLLRIIVYIVFTIRQMCCDVNVLVIICRQEHVATGQFNYTVAKTSRVSSSS